MGLLTDFGGGQRPVFPRCPTKLRKIGGRLNVYPHFGCQSLFDHGPWFNPTSNKGIATSNRDIATSSFLLLVAMHFRLNFLQPLLRFFTAHMHVPSSSTVFEIVGSVEPLID